MNYSPIHQECPKRKEEHKKDFLYDFNVTTLKMNHTLVSFWDF